MSEWTDGEYPTEAAVERVASWKIESYPDCAVLLAFVRSIWKYADCGYWTEEEAVVDGIKRPFTRYHVSTGGWSGNEDTLSGMRRNFMLWSLAWQQSRRGGHYIFEIPAPATPGSTPSAHPDGEKT